LNEERFNNLKNFEIFKDDVLITCAGTLGKVAIVPDIIERGIINSVLMRFRVRDIKEVLPYYIFILLKSDYIQTELVEYSYGTNQKNMRPVDEIRELLIPIPPIEIQEEIINEKNKLDSNVDELKKQILKLKNDEQIIVNDLWE
ncbi:MAG: restriction endonuclease subunit S, partial [Bryobacteraceae bacterium]